MSNGIVSKKRDEYEIQGIDNSLLWLVFIAFADFCFMACTNFHLSGSELGRFQHNFGCFFDFGTAAVHLLADCPQNGYH